MSLLLCLGAIEKQKLVYILNRDAAARLTISSPLEAHKANTLVYHVVGVDVGFENPMFACLEMDYEVGSGKLQRLDLKGRMEVSTSHMSTFVLLRKPTTTRREKPQPTRSRRSPSTSWTWA